MSIKDFFKKIFSKVVWGNCLGMALAAIAFVVGTLVFLQYYTHHGEDIAVPNLRGQSLDVAAKKLEILGLKVEVTDTGYVRTLPADVVLAQSIQAGEEVKPGRVIYLTINSLSIPTIALPDVADNCSRREAETRLANLGFVLGKPEFIQGEADWVYSVKVNGNTVSAGMRVPVGSPVTLVVGNGLTEEEFNGNDSLDYIYFGSGEEDSLSNENPGTVEDVPNTMPLEEYNQGHKQ